MVTKRIGFAMPTAAILTGLLSVNGHAQATLPAVTGTPVPAPLSWAYGTISWTPPVNGGWSIGLTAVSGPLSDFTAGTSSATIGEMSTYYDFDDDFGILATNMSGVAGSNAFTAPILAWGGVSQLASDYSIVASGGVTFGAIELSGYAPNGTLDPYTYEDGDTAYLSTGTTSVPDGASVEWTGDCYGLGWAN